MNIPDPNALAKLEPRHQANILKASLWAQLETWAPTPLPVADLALDLLRRFDDPASFALRLACATHLLWAGRWDALDGVLAPLLQGPGDGDGTDGDIVWGSLGAIVLAAQRSLQGDWADAEARYDPPLAALRKALGRRKDVLPDMLALPYLQALLAQGSPAPLDKALKFALTETGKKVGGNDRDFGLVALAVQMHRGDLATDLAQYRPLSTTRYNYRIDLWRWLMRGWLQTEPTALPLGDADAESARRLVALMGRLGLPVLGWQVDCALALLQGEPLPAAPAAPGPAGPTSSARPPVFFVPSTRETWRNALDALSALAAPAKSAGTDARSDRTRLLWVVSLSQHGAVRDIVPHEQKQGPRGWSKPKPVPLLRLSKTETLPPLDAAVARAVRAVPYSARGQRLDLAAAIVALVGHPAVAFDDAPELLCELAEGQPELDVIDAGESLHVRLLPSLHKPGDVSDAYWPQTATEQAEALALRGITLVRDTPQRARLIRLTPAQRQAAQLIGAQLTVPKAGLPQLQKVLQGLGTHFQIHADGLQAANVREVPADARLRAELAPHGDGITLRLVALPFGAGQAHGPRVTPGHGRAHMIAAVGGESLGVQRDLALERTHLDAVIDACPALAADARVATVSADWVIESPDDALALVEALPRLPAIAGLDWPKGKSIQVATAGVGQLQVRLHSGREWLALQGDIEVDEKAVMGLQALLQWTQAGNAGRFVPLGQGRYLALTQELRTRLDDLASVAHGGGKGGLEELRVPPVAAAWLQDTLAGMQLDADAAFGERLARLQAAQYTVPLLPPTLQAQFRPYQEEGYAWAMRLAAAGFGAILADDMGLGKTLQALAVLAARAPGGPALVVAPTSLMGNWCAEARRFAPGLRLRIFGRAGDTADVADAATQQASDGAQAKSAAGAATSASDKASPGDGDGDGAAGDDRLALIGQAGPGDVVVVSYTLLQIHADAFAGRTWHTLVADEAQAIKNAAAKRSQAAFDVPADFRLALSGTPIENRLSELWSLMRLCNPGLLGSTKQFNERFAAPIERDRNRTAQRILRRLIAPFILRRTKAQVLDDLPPRTEQTLMLEAEPAERAHYEALRRQALEAAERAVASDKPGEAHMNILAQLTRLRRAACDPRLVTPQIGLVGAKVQAFGELAAELKANGHKALVFSQFVDFLALLREPLDAAGIAYQYLDGSTPSAERSRRVDAFQAGQGDFFLISLKAGGFGLNLTLADYVVIADPWWNPAAEDQASGRAHRIGQQRPVTVYRLVNQGTLEERIVALHQTKRELADSVLEGGEVSGLLRADELVELIRGSNRAWGDDAA